MAATVLSQSAAEKYRKLPGRVSWLVSAGRLWLGRDHLLAATTSWGVERYRRFYFKDIEAFVVRRTARRLTWNVVFGAVAGLIAGFVGMIAWISSNFAARPGGLTASPVLMSSLAGILLLGALLMLFNTLRGQTCAVFVQTASGLTRLDAPVRTRAARRVIALVAPEIERAQAESP